MGKPDIDLLKNNIEKAALYDFENNKVFFAALGYANNVVVTDTLPENFVATEIYMENNGVRYVFDPSEYTINDANLLTLPNATGTAILVPAVGPGVDNTTRIRIQGHL